MAERVGKDWRARLTHCPRGHEYTEANTYLARQKYRDGVMRQCRTCRQMRDKQRRRDR